MNLQKLEELANEILCVLNSARCDIGGLLCGSAFDEQYKLDRYPKITEELLNDLLNKAKEVSRIADLIRWESDKLP